MRLGLIALGDSITNGDGEPALGVPYRSWALWLAQALELPYTNLAWDGAVIVDVVLDQLPRVRAEYDLACLFIGVNDVRGPGWDAERYATDLERALQALPDRAARVLVLSVPRDLGRPRAGAAKVDALNATIWRLAGAHGASVASLDDLRGARVMLPDAVHPTALGQLEIADRAALALAGRGPLPCTLPSALRSARSTPTARARFTARWGVLLAKDLLRRAWERWSI